MSDEEPLDLSTRPRDRSAETSENENYEPNRSYQGSLETTERGGESRVDEGSQVGGESHVDDDSDENGEDGRLNVYPPPVRVTSPPEVTVYSPDGSLLNSSLLEIGKDDRIFKRPFNVPRSFSVDATMDSHPSPSVQFSNEMTISRTERSPSRSPVYPDSQLQIDFSSFSHSTAVDTEPNPLVQSPTETDRHERTPLPVYSPARSRKPYKIKPLFKGKWKASINNALASRQPPVQTATSPRDYDETNVHIDETDSDAIVAPRSSTPNLHAALSMDRNSSLSPRQTSTPVETAYAPRDDETNVAPGPFTAYLNEVASMYRNSLRPPMPPGSSAHTGTASRDDETSVLTGERQSDAIVAPRSSTPYASLRMDRNNLIPPMPPGSSAHTTASRDETSVLTGERQSDAIVAPRSSTLYASLRMDRNNLIPPMPPGSSAHTATASRDETSGLIGERQSDALVAPRSSTPHDAQSMLRNSSLVSMRPGSSAQAATAFDEVDGTHLLFRGRHSDAIQGPRPFPFSIPPPLSIPPPSISPFSIPPPSISPLSIPPPSISPFSIPPPSIPPLSISPFSIPPPSMPPFSIPPFSIPPPSIPPFSMPPPPLSMPPPPLSMPPNIFSNSFSAAPESVYSSMFSLNPLSVYSNRMFSSNPLSVYDNSMYSAAALSMYGNSMMAARARDTVSPTGASFLPPMDNASPTSLPHLPLLPDWPATRTYAVAKKRTTRASSDNSETCAVSSTSKRETQSSSSRSSRGRYERHDASPGVVKDKEYFERRAKNNEAAKKSRDARREKENEIAERAVFFEYDNAKLRAEIIFYNSEITRLRDILYSSKDPKPQ